ncbi:MAG: acetyl-CoA carboxylase biotin carboxylase subunit [Polyangiaceae bacterium]
MLKKVLVANRGEIAVRIIRTLREMDIRSVAVFSDADRAALHVRMADEAVHIGAAPAAESYLDVERILDAARQTGADALHPGYGFLSENEQLVVACAAAGVTFVGPPVEAIRSMGSKTEARAKMIEAGLPVVPGGQAGDIEEARKEADRIGYPVMIKAAMGGGGKGIRLVHRADDLEHAYERAKSEAGASFGDATVYLERAIIKPRHVEIQLLGDQQGHVVHLFERDCSIQRRHQKVVEEAPCPAADATLIEEMGQVAIRAAKAVGYFSAGTVEFLLDESGAFYFLEMNTRLQVEHPITEWITGIDLVREMVRIAAGEPLGYGQDGIRRNGASIECRIYAEDPNRFLPSPGTVTRLRTPGGPFVRDDGGVYSGFEVSPHYDPLISKVSTWGPDRATAIRRMSRALSEYVVTGIRTNIAFHQRLLAHPEFLAGRYHTGFIEEHADRLTAECSTERDEGQGAGATAALATALAVAVSQTERRRAQGSAGENQSGPSEWLRSHRLRQLS